MSKPLCREFLLARGRCCHNGCQNCPWEEEVGGTNFFADVSWGTLNNRTENSPIMAYIDQPSGE